MVCNTLCIMPEYQDISQSENVKSHPSRNMGDKLTSILVRKCETNSCNTLLFNILPGVGPGAYGPQK